MGTAYKEVEVMEMSGPTEDDDRNAGRLWGAVFIVVMVVVGLSVLALLGVV